MAMASPCEVHVADGDRSVAQRVLDLVSTEAWRVEDKFSRYRAGNIVHEINRSEGRAIVVDAETARLLDYADELFKLSDGSFDITSGVLRAAWRFDGSDRVPRRVTVAALLARVGWQRVRWRAPELTLRRGMEIDFGGIGKEYAVDRAAALAKSVCNSCLINFGGDLLALGPSVAGRPWQVGVESLSQQGQAVRQIELTCGALATSGDARRFVLKNGKRYGHILNPKTGWPVEGVPRSVTVAAATCTQAGMLATFSMLRGGDAESFLDAQGVKYWCLR
jgi:thiamine biosynthesis lipoprotein